MKCEVCLKEWAEVGVLRLELSSACAKHLEGCAECRWRVGQMGRVEQVMRGAVKPSVPALGFRAGVMNRVRAEQSRVGKRGLVGEGWMAAECARARQEFQAILEDTSGVYRRQMVEWAMGTGMVMMVVVAVLMGGAMLTGWGMGVGGVGVSGEMDLGKEWVGVMVGWLGASPWKVGLGSLMVAAAAGVGGGWVARRYC